jgi:hypothetical protein
MHTYTLHIIGGDVVTLRARTLDSAIKRAAYHGRRVPRRAHVTPLDAPRIYAVTVPAGHGVECIVARVAVWTIDGVTQ